MAAVGFDDEMGGLTVQRIALVIQFLQFGQRVGNLQQRPVAVVTGTLQQGFWASMQINNRAVLAQNLSVSLRNTEPPPVDKTMLRREASFFSILVSRLRKPSSPSISKMVGMDTPRRSADFVVAVVKRAFKHLGKLLAQSGFARAHQPD